MSEIVREAKPHLHVRCPYCGFDWLTETKQGATEPQKSPPPIPDYQKYRQLREILGGGFIVTADDKDLLIRIPNYTDEWFESVFGQKSVRRMTG